MGRLRLPLVLLLALVGIGAAATPAPGQTIVDEWTAAKLPPPPQLKPVAINAKETALLVMDFTNQTCSKERRPRCANSVAKGSSSSATPAPGAPSWSTAWRWPARPRPTSSRS